MEYEMMIPPFERVDFKDMKKRQAQEYFDWYIEECEKRMCFLRNQLQIDGIEEPLDYSIESLITVWRWMENQITYRELKTEEYQKKKDSYPEWMQPYVSQNDFSYKTLMYCMDVAIYFARVVIMNSEGNVKWGFFTSPKTSASVNEPTLLGFKHHMDLNPRRVVLNCLRRSRTII